MLVDHFKNHSAELALDDLTQQHSWAEVEAQVAGFIALFDDYGLTRGDHVALLMSNRVDYIEVVIAAILAGIWVTPVNWHLAGAEIAYIVDDCEAKLLLHDDAFSELAAQLTLASWNVDNKVLPCAALSVDMQAPPGAVMMYTSGTTGRPKGVRRAQPATVESALAAQCSAGCAVGLDGEGSHLVTGPLYHAAPMLYALYDLANGAAMVIMPRFDARQALTLIGRRQISHSHWVPTMFIRALNCRGDGVDLSSLTRVLHGAAPIAVELKRELLHWWGPVLEEYWGGTESGVVSRCSSEQWLQAPGSVGRALPQFDIFAVDGDGCRLPFDSVGSLAIRRLDGERFFDYHRAVAKTEASYLDDNSFLIGDIGRVDEGGNIFLLDRDKHMIISGGVNIYPAEIEAVLQGHSAVVDVAVFGIPDPEWGEQVKAAVQLDAGCDWTAQQAADELIGYLKGRIASFKVPRSFDLHEQLPRYDSGKLYVQRLKSQYWQV